jgi:hypothetical protein
MRNYLKKIKINKQKTLKSKKLKTKKIKLKKQKPNLKYNKKLRFVALPSIHETLYVLDEHLLDKNKLENKLENKIENKKKITFENKELSNTLSLSNNYIKYNKYQFINNNYNGLNRNTYKDNLTEINFNDIENNILEYKIKNIISKNNSLSNTSNTSNTFNKSNNISKILDNIIIVELNKNISNNLLNDIKNLFLEFGKIYFLILEHNINKVFIFPDYANISNKSKSSKSSKSSKLSKLSKTNKSIKSTKSTKSTKSKSSKLNEKELNEKELNKIIINKLNQIINNCQDVINTYDKFVSFHTPSKDYNEMLEHIIFNSSFDYLKTNGLFNKLNPKYINNFNDKVETVFTNNKYIQLYYPPLPNNKKLKLQMTNVGLYSISKPYATLEIIKYIKQSLSNMKQNPKTMTITDATAGLGGDTIAFAKIFKKVNSVEIQKNHHLAKKNNCDLYGFKNINHILDDYTKIYNKLNQDIVFIDSPWGGTAYGNRNVVDLQLFGSDIKFIDFVITLLKKNVIIYLKTPANFNVKGLKNQIDKSKMKKEMKVFNVRNFLLILLY